MTNAKLLNALLGPSGALVVLLLLTARTAAAAPLLSEGPVADGPIASGLNEVVESYRDEALAELPAIEPSDHGYLARAQDLVRDATLEQVPELDPGVAHSSLALLFGAIAIVLGRRNR